MVQMWHKALEIAKGEKEWLKRHPEALSKHIREEAAAGKRFERNRGLAQASQYRRWLRVSSPFNYS